MANNEAWVYAQTQPETFLKTKIDIGKPLGDGYFVAMVQASGLGRGL